MSTNIKHIQAGITYLRMLRNMSVPELADDLEESEAHIKMCIAAAKAHKDLTEKKPTISFIEPLLKIYSDIRTGERQAVQSVSVELLKPVIVNFGHEKETEFTTLLPVKVKIIRP